MHETLLALGILGGLAAWWFGRNPAEASPAPSSGSTPPRRLSLLEVEQLAKHTVALGGYAGDVDPAMLIGLAWIESAFDARAVGDGGRSIGLMQIQASTAEDITRRLGGRGYSSPEDLHDPSLAMDFAARYLAWLRTWNGVRRSDRWMIEAYNGGAGTAAAGGNTLTRRHACRWAHTVAAYRAGQALPNVAALPC